MFRRIRTDSTLQTQSKARRRTNTLPYESDTGKVQDRFPAYEEFPWEKIREYLNGKWPEWTEFQETRVSAT